MLSSQRKNGEGFISGYGELTANKVVLKKIRDFRILNQEQTITGKPFVLKVGIEGNVQVAPYIFAKCSVGLEAPVDIQQIGLGEAFIECKEIVYDFAANMLQELKQGVLVRDNPAQASATFEAMDEEEMDKATAEKFSQESSENQLPHN